MVDIDGLTGVANRRYRDDLLLRDRSRPPRKCTSAPLRIAGVDHFRRYDNTYGRLDADDSQRRSEAPAGRRSRGARA